MGKQALPKRALFTAGLRRITAVAFTATLALAALATTNATATPEEAPNTPEVAQETGPQSTGDPTTTNEAETPTPEQPKGSTPASPATPSTTDTDISATAQGDYTANLTVGSNFAGTPGQARIDQPITFNLELVSDTALGEITFDIEFSPQVQSTYQPTAWSSAIASYSWSGNTATITTKPLQDSIVSFQIPGTVRRNFSELYPGQELVTRVLSDGGQVLSEASLLPLGRLDYPGGVGGEFPWNNVTLSAIEIPGNYLIGSGNRIVKSTFRLLTREPNFIQWNTRITAQLEPGTIVLDHFTENGRWSCSGEVNDGQICVLETNGPVNQSWWTNLPWLQVEYPPASFANAVQPKITYVVEAQTYDQVRDDTDVFFEVYRKTVASLPLADPETEGILVRECPHGAVGPSCSNNLTHAYTMGSGNISPGPSTSSMVELYQVGGVDKLSLADAYTGNEQYWSQVVPGQLVITANDTLASEPFPVTIEYAVNGDNWRTLDGSFTTQDFASGSTVSFLVQGSTGYGTPIADAGLTEGERLTGWRITVDKTVDEKVPRGSSLTVKVAYSGSVYDATQGTTSFPNLVTGEALVDGGPPKTSQATAKTIIRDALGLNARVVEYSTPWTVGKGGAATVCVSNFSLDQAYSDSYLKVPLPTGITYDPTVGVNADKRHSNFYGYTIPEPGAGLSVEVEEDPATGGQNLLLKFADPLLSIYPLGKAWMNSGYFSYSTAFCYKVGVHVSLDAVDDYVPLKAVPMQGSTEGIAMTVQQRVLHPGEFMVDKTVRAGGAGVWSKRAGVSAFGDGVAEWRVQALNMLPGVVTDQSYFDFLPDAGAERIVLSGPVTVVAPDDEDVDVFYTSSRTNDDRGVCGAEADGWSLTPESLDSVTGLCWKVRDLETGEKVEVTYQTKWGAGDPRQRLGGTVIDVPVRVSLTYASVPMPNTSAASLEVLEEPRLGVVKTTNEELVEPGESGPVVLVDEPVTWRYVVTNEGNTYLDDLTLVDAFTDGEGGTGAIEGADISVESGGSGLLAPGEDRTFKASGTATAGQYVNEVVVDASVTSPTGDPVTGVEVEPASASSAYFGALPSVSVVKLTNGVLVGGDGSGRPVVLVGGGVEWVYRVTNTGNTCVAFGDIDLVDVWASASGSSGSLSSEDGTISELVLPPNRGVGDGCGDGELSPGWSGVATASGSALRGLYENTVTVSGVDVHGLVVDPVSASSSYLGVQGGLEVSKLVNGVRVPEASATGLFVPVGEAVSWSFMVENTGDFPVMLDSLVDEGVDGDGVTRSLSWADVSCVGGVTRGSVLAGGEVVVCETTGEFVSVAGLHENTVSVTGVGEGPGGVLVPLSASAVSRYFGSVPGLSVEKTTNGSVVGSAPGEVLLVGEQVRWDYRVTNGGNRDLGNVAVRDVDVDGNVVFEAVIEWLPAGESVDLYQTGVVALGQYENTVSVTAIDPDDAMGVLGDSASSWYFGTAPSLSVVKELNGVVVESAPGPDLVAGSEIGWSFVVTNHGNLPVTNLEVVDVFENGDGTTGAIVVTDGVGPNGETVLEAGASWRFTQDGEAIKGRHHNTVTATADTIPPTNPADPENPENPAESTDPAEPADPVGLEGLLGAGDLQVLDEAFGVTAIAESWYNGTQPVTPEPVPGTDPDPVAGKELPKTGGDLLIPVFTAIALISAGAVLLTARRKQTRQR